MCAPFGVSGQILVQFLSVSRVILLRYFDTVYELNVLLWYFIKILSIVLTSVTEA